MPSAPPWSPRPAWIFVAANPHLVTASASSAHPPTGKRSHRPHLVHVSTRVQQRTEGHVARNTREAVEPGQ